MPPAQPGASFALSAGVAAVVSLLVLATRRWHLRATADSQWHMPQKIHSGEIPRIGGVAVACGFLVALAVQVAHGGSSSPISVSTATLIALGLVPVFLIGLVEDVTKRVGARVRLLWMAFGAVVLIQFLNLVLSGIDAPLLDACFGYSAFALAFSVFACVGAANAFNIVDGLNGLLGGIALITLAAVAWVAAAVGDAKVLTLACLLAGAVAGWMPFNWPRARLFAGDGGAYSLGFVIAALLLMLSARHPGAVSPWFGLTAAALPVWETVYSIWRRMRRGEGAMEADQSHLHQLVRLALHRACLDRAMRHAQRMAVGADAGDARQRLARIAPPNSSASPLLWLLHAAAAAAGARFYGETFVQLAVFTGFALVYVALHGRLLKARDAAAAVVHGTPRRMPLPAIAPDRAAPGAAIPPSQVAEPAGLRESTPVREPV
jgi:UDP-GlcNAc:undecaprenyl-phosphate GlcNAc-1-phosphate transferase